MSVTTGHQGRTHSRSIGRHRADRRVLVVDDHEDTRDVLEAILKAEGYDVLLAPDGEAATELYRRHPTDLVILDLFMPGKGGIQTIIDLRREFQDVKIIAMSADRRIFSRHDALTQATAAGAQLAIRKPLEPWVVLKAVAHVLAA